MKIRTIILPLVLVSAWIGLVLWQVLIPSQPAFVRSFSPLFRAVGVGGMGINNLFTRALPLDSMDEAAWGRLYREHHEGSKGGPHGIYLQAVLDDLTAVHGRRELEYRAYIVEDPVRNAWALAGGTILVTRGLLDEVDTQAELAAILLHELAHIERGHCLALVRSQILKQKHPPLRPLEALDFLLRLSLETTWSKTQEDEADHWAFDALAKSGYHPMAMSAALRHIVDQGEVLTGGAHEQGLFRDWFASHPDLAHRVDQFREKAELIMQQQPDAQWRIGARAYKVLDSSDLSDSNHDYP